MDFFPPAPISTVAWKEIETYPNYLVSSEGVVKNKKRGNVISQIISNGYCLVSLRNADGCKHVRVHRLVAKAFLPKPRDDQTQVNHKDNNKKNNNLDNLEWCSGKENMYHFRQQNPTSLPKIKLIFSKEGEEPKEFSSISAAAKHYKKSLSTIWGASLNGRWNGYKVERVTLNTSVLTGTQ